MGFAAREDALLDAARAATRLEDFGAGPWRDGLRVLLRCYDEEARFSDAGRARAEAELVGILCARLLTEAGLAADPGCREQPVDRPLFILGLPRTGTTALHFLLAQDPDCQVLPLWLAAMPSPRPPREQWESDPRFRATAAALEATWAEHPHLAALHLMTADGPEECRQLLQQTFLDDTFDSNATIPGYTRWFAAQDVRPAYARHREALQLIGSTTPGKRWVLKYPAHIRNLDVVLETYPDACFVQTHRDPARVLPSICSLVAGWRAVYEGPGDDRAIGRWQLDMWASMMERGIAKRAALDPARFFDLHFSELVADPIGAVKRIYDHFGSALSEEAERRMRRWQAEDPHAEHGGKRHDAERFGLDDAAIADRFAAYLERFDVAAEPRR